jgi:hypothetical protein
LVDGERNSGIGWNWFRGRNWFRNVLHRGIGWLVCAVVYTRKWCSSRIQIKTQIFFRILFKWQNDSFQSYLFVFKIQGKCDLILKKILHRFFLFDPAFFLLYFRVMLAYFRGIIKLENCYMEKFAWKMFSYNIVADDCVLHIFIKQSCVLQQNQLRVFEETQWRRTKR